MARVLRRRDQGFPRRRWLGRDPSFPGGARRVDPRREPPRLPLWGALLLPRPPHGGRARRSPLLSLASSVLPSVRLCDREPDPAGRPGSCSSPPRVRRTDRRETSAGPKGGEAGGRCGRSPLGASPSARGRRAARPRLGPAVSRSPRRRGRPLSAPPSFPPQTRGPGTRDVAPRPGVGGGSKPRAASRGEAGDRGAPPRLPTSPPAAAGPPERRGPGPSRAPGPLSVETQLFASRLVYLSVGGAARRDPPRLNRQ